MFCTDIYNADESISARHHFRRMKQYPIINAALVRFYHEYYKLISNWIDQIAPYEFDDSLSNQNCYDSKKRFFIMPDNEPIGEKFIAVERGDTKINIRLTPDNLNSEIIINIVPGMEDRIFDRTIKFYLRDIEYLDLWAIEEITFWIKVIRNLATLES